MTNASRAFRTAAGLLLMTTLAACGDNNITNTAAPTPTPLGGTQDQIQLCAQAPNNQLCSFIPHDVIAPNLNGNGYSQLGAAEQQPFDNFSWQMFVALNWPATKDGTPIGSSIADNPDAPRVWNSYPTSLEIFGVNVPGGLSASPSPCAALGDGDLPVLQLIAKSGDVDHEHASILQATKNPLIDRNLNFVLYDIRANPIESQYIRSNSLNTQSGQLAFMQSGQSVEFPLGSYADDSTRMGGSVGAVEIKSAWRILDTSAGDDLSRFYTEKAHVYVSAAASQSGEAFCFTATLGLVGMHILQRTSGPRTFGLDWIWATFEHVDNAPLSQAPGDPTSFSPATPCDAPTSVSKSYSFFNPACTGAPCPPNTVPTPEPTVGYQWATTPPYARQYAINGSYGTQVVRCWDIYSETQSMNAVFRKQLQGTVWANYQLINSQWQGGIENPEDENGNIPRFLGNSVLETTIQESSSCLECHAYATTTAGQDANFSFLLGLAKANTAH